MQIKDFLTHTFAEVLWTCLPGLCIYLTYNKNMCRLSIRPRVSPIFFLNIKSHTWVKKSIKIPMSTWQESIRLKRLI